MGDTLVSELMSSAGKTLLDDDFIRWEEEEWIVHANAAQRIIAFVEPSAWSERVVQELQPGITQAITGIQLIKLIKNMGSDGSTPGRVITPLNQDKMDRYNPYWQASDPAPEILHYMYDPEVDKKYFSTFPPRPSASPGHAELLQSNLPTPITLEKPGYYDVKITIGDMYRDVMEVLMLHFAYRKDSGDSTLAAQRSLSYLDMALKMLGRRDLIDQELDPLKQKKE